MDGFLVLDKPPGLSSHDLVAILRSVSGVAKVGHTGTLDPFATGVLPMALGRATRWIQYLDEHEKVYNAGLLLGASTDTGDPTGTVIQELPVPAISEAQVQALLQRFVGPRMQLPPRYSAIKVSGRPLYDYARAGQEVEVQARPIEIFRMELLNFAPPLLQIRIHCSRGSYARVIAEEIAQALGTVGHLISLRREQSGAFQLDHALSLSQLSQLVAQDPDWNRCLRTSKKTERVPWLPKEDVQASLVPWLQSPLPLLKHLPSLQLSAAELQLFQRGGNAPERASLLPKPCMLLSGDQLLTILPSRSTSP